MSSETTGLGTWEALADALRDEMAEYGGLIQLLDEQKDAILQMDADALEGLSAQVEEQLQAAQRFRLVREGLQQAVAAEPGMSIRQLIDTMPPYAQPMFEALLEGADDLVKRSQERTRRNRVLLARAAEINEQILRRIQPQSISKTYNARGGVSMKALRKGGLDMSA